MKQLYLFRHAEAREKAPGTSDEMRELTARGRDQSTTMADYFARENIHPDAVFCSNAIRARQTLMIAMQSLPLPSPKVFYENDLYEAPPDGLIDFISTFDDAYIRVMLVGHNPSLSLLAEHLTGSPVSMTTAAVVTIQLPVAQWRAVEQETGTLLGSHHPAFNEKKESSK